jgi:hypothetical protein
MGKSIPVSIGNKHFASKTEAQDFVRSLVAKYSIGDFLNAEDKAFCLEMFSRHPHYPHKLAPGVDKIQLRVQEKGTKGFQIYKIDGTNDNISWTDCLAK